MHLTLFLPPWAGPATGWPGPALGRLLARADRLPDDRRGADAALCALFDPALAEAPPVAALGALGLGLDDSCRHWLRADPVHLQPARDDLVVTPADDLTAAEAQSLAAPLAAHLLADDLVLRSGAPTEWFVALKAPARLRTVPLAAVHGRPMGNHLPQGEDARVWLARLTELQMLLHDHPCNAARERDGKAPVNGLWLWGEGMLPARPSPAFDAVCGEDALSRGLARAAGLAAHPVPAGFADLPRAARVLVVLHASSDAHRLDACWIAPLMRALRAATVRSATIMLGGMPTRCWRARPRHHWRFWRRAWTAS